MQILPKEIKELIGYSGWTALGWALHNGWVQDYKWPIERMLVPVDSLLKINDNLCREYLLSTADIMAFNVNMFADKCYGIDGRNFRNLMIEGYLLGTDFVSPLRVRDPEGFVKCDGIIRDKNGINQLDGELRRYWSGTYGIRPEKVKLHRQEVFIYCENHKLREEAYNNFAKKLNLDAGREFD